jgi:farnesyl-diphosphate farnesyltransferase
MTVPNSTKLPLLRSLHLKLHEPGWTFDGSGPNEKDRQVLIEFDVIQAEFAQLDPKSVTEPCSRSTQISLPAGRWRN